MQEAGYFWGTVIGLGCRAGGGFEGVTPDIGGFGGIPHYKKSGVLGGVPLKRVLLKSTNLD